jgi:hypothetical protein
METIKYALEARLTPAEGDEGWITLPGFMYDTPEELRAVYDEHFAAIEGMGNEYRFAKITETVTHEPFIIYHKEELPR